MPYSKNPDKYPPEMQILPEMLKRAVQSEYNIPTGTEAEARGRKAQIQSYFTAIEARATAMRQLAARGTVEKGSAVARQDQLADAHAIATLWEDRARVIAGWMVRVVVMGGQPYVQIARRTAGDFGAAMAQVFGAAPPVAAQPAVAGALRGEHVAQSPAPTDLEGQLALLQQAAAQLEADPTGSTGGDGTQLD